MKKKLVLHRTAIMNLHIPTLKNVIGGDQASPLYAGVQSVKVDTRVEPCQVISGAHTRGRQ